MKDGWYYPQFLTHAKALRLRRFMVFRSFFFIRSIGRSMLHGDWRPLMDVRIYECCEYFCPFVGPFPLAPLFATNKPKFGKKNEIRGGKGEKGKEGGWNGTTRMAPSPVSETFTPSPELHSLPPNTRETIQLPFFNSVDNFCRSLSSPASLTSFHAVRLCSHGKLLPHCPLIRTSFPARTFFGLFAIFKFFFPSPLLDATTLTCPYFAT